MSSLAQTLEWFQCKGCGRRHRWQADIAGAEIECSCGKTVFCPELDVFGDVDSPSDTVVSRTGAPVMGPAGLGSDHFPAEFVPIEGEAYDPDAAPSYQRKRAGGLFGMGPFGETVFWLVGAAVGFTLIVHAIVLQWPIYIALTVIWTPLSFWKFHKKLKRWQGNRSLLRAFEEEFESD